MLPRFSEKSWWAPEPTAPANGTGDRLTRMPYRRATRLMMIRVTGELICNLLRGEHPACYVAECQLPDDARIVGSVFDGRDVTLAFESEQFELVAAGAEIPFFTPIYREVQSRKVGDLCVI